MEPELTGPAIRTATGPHFAVRDDKVLGNGLLLITIAGTNSRAQALLPFAQTAAALGYSAVGIDYPNSRITTDCRGNSDRLCFDKFRREIDLGDPVSDLVQVNRENSLVNRIEKLLQYLVKKYPTAQWNQFIKNGKADWEKIVLAGHSQGAGHAAFLAKAFRVHSVICLAGPQDGNTWGIASWILAPGKTPGVRYSALLHKEDFFKSEIQIAALRGLIGDPKAPAFIFANEIPPGKHPSILVSTLTVKDPHMSVISETFKSAWIYLLNNSSALKTAMFDEIPR